LAQKRLAYKNVLFRLMMLAGGAAFAEVLNFRVTEKV